MPRTRSPSPVRRQWANPPTRIYPPGSRERAESDARQARSLQAQRVASPPRASTPPRQPPQWLQPPTRIWAPGERERLEWEARRAREEEARRRDRELEAVRRARDKNRIRPLQERDKDLFRLLFRSRPIYNDAVVRRYWGHMEAVWKEALMGYRWCWRPARGAAPYRGAVDLPYVRVLVRQLQWISGLHMKDIV